ncbi:hypothetical protein ACINLE_17635 [Bacillus sp. z60-18]|uniref:hypothetical protein n=1 Tax=unclassified Bacillus (in: firmicutes) TaxID=185979 RepID=UPI00390C7F2D
MEIKVKIEAPGLTEALQTLAEALASVKVSPVKGPELETAQAEPLNVDLGPGITASKIGSFPAESLASAKIEEAKIEVPEAEPEKTKSAKAKAKAPKVEEAPAIDKKVVREKLASKAQEGKQAQVKELLRKFGAEKLSEIPEEKYADLLELVEEL